MTKGQARSAYEASLARASQQLNRAAEQADAIGDVGAVDDVLQLRQEVSRLLMDSVNGKKRPRRQLTL